MSKNPFADPDHPIDYGLTGRDVQPEPAPAPKERPENLGIYIPQNKGLLGSGFGGNQEYSDIGGPEDYHVPDEDFRVFAGLSLPVGTTIETAVEKKEINLKPLGNPFGLYLGFGKPNLGSDVKKSLEKATLEDKLTPSKLTGLGFSFSTIAAYLGGYKTKKND